MFTPFMPSATATAITHGGHHRLPGRRSLLQPEGAQGERWNWWIQRRAMRLWWPTAVYLGVNALAIMVATAAGGGPGHHRAGRPAGHVAAVVPADVNAVMTVYLWHFVPVLVIAAAFYPTGGLAATLFGLSWFTIAGFAPGGHLHGLPLAACAGGLAATLVSGRDPAAGAKPQALSPQQPPKAA